MDFVSVKPYTYFIKRFFHGLLCTFILMTPIDTHAETKKNSKDKKEFVQPKKPLLRLTEFKIPIFHSLHPYHTVRVNCTLEMEENSWTQARLNIPYIYHNIFKDLYYALNFLWRANEPPSKNAIKKRLLYVYNKHFTHKWPIKNIHINGITVAK